MALKEQLQKLASEKNNPCVTISLNTHQTYPDNEQDKILLKKLLKEAEERVINEFGKRDVANLLHNVELVAKEIDVNYNLSSLHIFLSNDTKEIIRSSIKTDNQGVQISKSFATRALINAYNRTQNYLVMLLSQSGVHLYEALNDAIIHEVKNEDFPFSENKYYNTNSVKASDSKHLDDLVKEFLNKVDKALVKLHLENDLNCVVIATEDNYGRLIEVADKPSIYLGYDNIDYNNVATHQIAKQSWEIVKVLQKQSRANAISEMKEAVAQGKVITDLQEIYQASIDGRGEVLIVHQDFKQPVLMEDERSFSLIEDVKIENAIDDITSNIAWNVISKKGDVYFTSQEEIKELGKIALKTRF
jgi:hypothetical protein